MRYGLAAAFTLLSVPFAAEHALAGPTAAAAGATTTVNVKITVKDSGKSDFASSTIERVLNAQCVMQAAAPMQIGMSGPTAEQQAAIAKSQAKSEALTQQLTPAIPSDYMVAQMEAAADKCGDDEACIMEFAQKMQNNPEFLAAGQAAAKAQGSMNGVVPDLGPTRYQLWQPQSCSGTIAANDVYVDSDPGGEGGDGAYTDTTTVKGSSPIHPDWRGMTMETDLVSGTTTYRMMPPPPVNIASQSTMKGAGQREIPLLANTPLPDTIGPVKGVGGKQSTKLKGKSGTVTVEWQQ
jgi:hypothetical protein